MLHKETLCIQTKRVVSSALHQEATVYADETYVVRVTSIATVLAIYFPFPATCHSERHQFNTNSLIYPGGARRKNMAWAEDVQGRADIPVVDEGG